MQLSALAASLNDSAQSLSAASEGETVFYENCAMRTEETNSNNDVRCLVMQSINDSISVGVFIVLTMFPKLRNQTMTL